MASDGDSSNAQLSSSSPIEPGNNNNDDNKDNNNNSAATKTPPSKKSPKKGSPGTSISHRIAAERELKITTRAPYNAKSILGKTLSFIRGPTCKRCSETAYLNLRKKGIHPPVRGLNSTYVTKHLLAINRPSNRLIEEYNILDAFKKQNIRAVMNLQIPGEHPHCGDGIGVEDGMSYSPELLYKHHIAYYNHCWDDMTAPSFSQMLSVAKIIAGHVKKDEKVAIHCHAGFGRTGICIAATIMLMDPRMTPQQTINYVRGKRKKCIQTWVQERFLHEFYELIRDVRVVYGSPKSKDGVAGGELVVVAAPEIDENDENTDIYDREGEVEEERDRWGDVIKPPFDLTAEIQKIYLEAKSAPPIPLRARHQILYKLPWHKISKEAGLKEKLGGRHIVGDIYPKKLYDNNSRGLRTDLREAIARQYILVHYEENEKLDLTNVPRTIRLLTTTLMQYSRFNPIAVAASLVGVGKSCWPGAKFSKDWDNACSKVFVIEGEGDIDDADEGSSPKKNLRRKNSGLMMGDVLHQGNIAIDGKDLKNISELEGTAQDEEEHEIMQRIAEANECEKLLDPIFCPPKWSAGDEERLVKMKKDANVGDFTDWKEMMDTSDSHEVTFDPRIPSQLLFDYLHQLTDPIVSTEPCRILGYDSDEKLDNKVDENIAVPNVDDDELVGESLKNTRWRVLEKGLVEELIALEVRMAKESSKKVKKRTPSKAENIFISKDEGVISAEDREKYPLDLEETLKLYLIFVQSPKNRSNVECIMRVLIKCKNATPVKFWKEACCRVGVALTQFDKTVENRFDNKSIFFGRDLIDFNVREEGAVVKIWMEDAVAEGARQTAAQVAENGGENLAKLRMKALASLENSSQSIADHVLLLGRFVESLSFFFENISSLKMGESQRKASSHLLRAGAFFDIQTGRFQLMEGFTGQWNDDFVPTSVEAKKARKKVDLKQLATQKLDLRKVVLPKDVNPFAIVGGATFEHSNIKNNFDPENIKIVQAQGGCEGLFNSHISDVYHHRRIAQDKHYEVLQRSIYLFHLRELSREAKEKESAYTFSTVKKKVKRKKSTKKRIGLPVERAEEEGDGGEQLAMVTKNSLGSPAKIVPV